VLSQAHLAGVIDRAAGAIEVPRTGEELRRVKKVARERSVEDVERLFVLEALKRNDWNVTQSARDTAMLRSNFHALMKKYDIHARDGGQATDDGEPDGDAAP
jgi:transcriptional regulator of acetoin/glycerol metabolism